MGVYLVSGGEPVMLSDPLPWPEFTNYGGSGTASSALLEGGGIDPDALYREQPAVRKVVDFVARNVAQLGLHAFQRVNDTERNRLDRTHPLVETLREPSPGKTTYTLVDRFVHDLALWDRALLVKMRDQRTGKPQLRRVAPRRFRVESDSLGDVTRFRVGTSGAFVDLTPDQVMYVAGYAPTHQHGVTPIETLRPLLVELAEGSSYRAQLWRNGARQSGWIERPPTAPEWSDTAAKRFKSDWKQRWAHAGTEAGGTPVLEDGMTFHSEAFDAKASEYVEGRRLLLLEFASAWHVPPAMVGAIESATYSNLKEYRSILYADTLGPTLTQIEEAFDTQLVPEFDEGGDVYVEFNVDEKLRGNFEERISSMQSAVGRPWMVADEARARLNMPPLGGDAAQLVTPLNVVVGGQASPRDSVPAERGGTRARGAKAAQAATSTIPAVVERYNAELGRYVERQRQRILSALGAKAAPPLDDVFDVDGEASDLAVVMTRYGLLLASAGARQVLDRFEPDFDWSDDPMTAYVAAQSVREARAITVTTAKALADAVTGDDWKAEVRNVFDVLAGARAERIVTTSTTEMANFGRHDAAKAVGVRSKTWSVTSGNPRPSHAAMAGEVVDLSETFSNGARWPCDSNLDVDERAQCTCRLDFAD